MILYQLAISVYAFLIQFLSRFGYKKAQAFIEIRKSQTVKSFDIPHFWIHAASAGEGNQAIPLAIHIKEKMDCKVTISFFSPSGYHFHKNTNCFDQVLNLPIDQPKLVRKFIEQLQPDVAIFIRKEIWWNTLSNLKEKKIPTFLVNAHPNNFMQSKVLKGYHQKCLHVFQRIYFTEKAENELLQPYLVSDIVGDTKYENAFAITYQKDAVLEDFCGTSTIVIVGSSWPKEEQYIADYLHKQNHQDVKIIIAPHDIQSGRITEIQSKFFKNNILYSQYKPNSRVQVLILDVIGKLKNTYQYSDIAVVGGGFGKGVHNILEAVACFKPVLIGPNYHQFSEATELVNKQLVFTFDDSLSFTKNLNHYIQFPEERTEISQQLTLFAQSKKSISNLIIEDIQQQINL